MTRNESVDRFMCGLIVGVEDHFNIYILGQIGLQAS